MVFEIFVSGQDPAYFLQIHRSTSSGGVRPSDFHRIQILSEAFAWDWEFHVRNVQIWRNIAEMVHSHVIRTMNLLTIDAHKKRPKLRIFTKENFWSHQNIKTLLSFQEKSQNLPVFSISLAHCVSQLWTNFQSQKTRFSRKIGSNH